MTRTLKATFAALALLVSASPATFAFAATNSGIYQSCQDGSYTPHGIWDCR